MFYLAKETSKLIQDHSLQPTIGHSTLGAKNWENIVSLDLPRFLSFMSTIRSTGHLPLSHSSLEASAHEQTTSQHKIPLLEPDVYEELSALIASALTSSPALSKDNTRFCILDGFLLFTHPEVIAQLDIRLFLRASRAVSKKRRAERPPYLTVDGWWRDPEHYFDRVVWPEYVASHAWMFSEGDVDGDRVDRAILEEYRVRTPEGRDEGGTDGETGFESVVRWAVDAIVDDLIKRK
jgi:nicotinamide/nicotinate riboside kinase